MEWEISTGGAAGSRGDDELLAAARQGDAVALEALLVRYQPHLYRFGLRMCGNVEDAGDVAQDSLLSMARSVRDFRGDASVSTWLYTIARRFCIRKRRRSKFAPAAEDPLDGPAGDAARGLADPAPGPEQTAAGRELETALIAAIDALEPGQREVLLLRDVEGLSAAEVAKVLDLGVDAVKSRLHRARVAVRQRLAPMLAAPAAPTGSGRRRRCPDVVRLFSEHLDGDIDPAVCARMEAHLVECGDCRGDCAALKRTLATCRALPPPPVPTSVGTAVKAAIRSFLAR